MKPVIHLDQIRTTGSTNPFVYTASNYSDLVATAVAPDTGNLAYVMNSQGTAWLPGTLGGTYYPKGIYIFDGTKWVSDRNAIAQQLQINVDDIATLEGIVASKLDSVVGGSNITIDNTDPLNPIINLINDIVVNTIQIAGGTGSQGTFSWNTSEETVQLVMNGTILHLGHDLFFHVRNNTGSTIPINTPVYISGTLGSSGRVTIAPFIADGTVDERLFLGVTTESIAANANGKVAYQTKLDNIDTSAWTDFDTLYPSPTTAGAWTNVEPTAPNLKMPIAKVVYSHATQGILEIRPNYFQHLDECHDVHIPTPADGDMLIYNGTNSRWEKLKSAWYTITFAASFTPDFSNGFNQDITLTADATLNAPTNLADGQSMSLIIKQDSTGGWVLTGGANIVTQNGAGINIDSTASSVNKITITRYGTSYQVEQGINYA